MRKTRLKALSMAAGLLGANLRGDMTAEQRGLQARQYGRYVARTPSDHFPVMAEVSFKK